MNPSAENQLRQLLESRYHGATNIAGIRYQIIYSVLRATDLLQENGPESIQLEGIEDLDVHGHREIELSGIRLRNEYIQVKTSKRAWDWSRFAHSNIIRNFLPVWCADSSVRLVIVTNFGYRDKLDELAKFCNGSRGTVSTKVLRDLSALSTQAGYPNIDVDHFVQTLRFERISNDDLVQRVEQGIVRAFGLTQPNSDLYYLVLTARFLEIAAERGQVRASDLQQIRLSIEETLAMGPVNPAIQQGWIEPLRFEAESYPEDYYEGKNARSGHILAGLDVRRPIWEDRIDQALHRSRLCVIRASSGQGKSTLLYRYAYEHFHPETALLVRSVGDESMVGPIKQVIEARMKLGLPVLVFIDNVGPGLRAWHHLVSQLSGHPIMFLVTMREEDWYRYSASTSGMTAEVVTPVLSIDEAKQIYGAFRQRGKVAAGVPSAEWAYEQVSDQKLLIEFTYLITHGEMLADRLHDQVDAFQRLGEDRAKAQVLRLVSVAQAYGARVPLNGILREVAFTGDPDATLTSLEREYVLFRDGECEGLHLVRSRHLVPLLHRILPVEMTMSQLIQMLEGDDLESFISNAFADEAVDHAVLMKALVERSSREPLGFANRVAAALFRASEEHYYHQHEHLFDSAFQDIGSAGVSILCWATVPVKASDAWDTLTKDFGDKFPNLTVLADLAAKFATRDAAPRFESEYLRECTANLSYECLDGFSEIAGFLGWCGFANADASRLVDVIAVTDWRQHLYHANAEHAGNFLEALSQFAPTSYKQLLLTEKAKLIEYYKLVSDTLLVAEQGTDLYIEFVVDETPGSSTPNDQAVARLGILAGFFPMYEHYRSSGLFASTFGMTHPVNDTEKNLSRKWLRLQEDAARNHTYMEVVQEHYACASVFEWQEQWFLLRNDLLGLVRQLIEFYRDLYRPSTPAVDALNADIRRCMIALQLLKELPASYARQSEKEQRSLTQWANEMHTFIRQFVEHDFQDGQNRSSYLMRVNLREAINHLTAMQAATIAIASRTQAYFDFADLDTQERQGYLRLVDVLDFSLEGPVRATRDLNHVVDEYRANKNRRFVDGIHTCLLPLETEGFRFVYPAAPVVDGILTGLVLGFEVIDFALFVEQMVAIMAQLAGFAEECHWIYFVPLLQGQRCTPNIWRISLDKAREIAEGELENKEWALLPIEPSAASLGVLPGVATRIPEEYATLPTFYQVLGALNVRRNLRHFLDTRLDLAKPFECELANRYQARIEDTFALATVVWEDVLRQFRKLAENNPAEAAWQSFCEACMKRISVYKHEDVVDADTFQPITILQDPELDRLLGHYLTVRYIQQAA